MRVPHLHEVYRAVAIGLQTGAAVVVPLCFLQLFGVAFAYPGVTFLVVSTMGALLALHVGTWRLPAAGRAVLVTGCDSGFGLALALRLQELGCVVFAGCLQAAHGDGAQQLRRLPRVHVLQLDVTDDNQVEAARRIVDENLQNNDLWGVVNNADTFLCSPMEWALPRDAQHIFNVNALGQLRVAKAFLPLLRRSRGRLVNVTSTAGRASCGPTGVFTGASRMSKCAAEALTDCLREEQHRFGVHVAAIDTGDFVAATSIPQVGPLRSSLAASWSSLSDEARAAYEAEGAGGPEALLQDFENEIAAPTSHLRGVPAVVASMEDALFSRWPASRYAPADLRCILRTWLRAHFPELLFEKFDVPANVFVPIL